MPWASPRSRLSCAADSGAPPPGWSGSPPVCGGEAMPRSPPTSSGGLRLPRHGSFSGPSEHEEEYTAAARGAPDAGAPPTASRSGSSPLTDRAGRAARTRRPPGRRGRAHDGRRLPRRGRSPVEGAVPATAVDTMNAAPVRGSDPVTKQAPFAPTPRQGRSASAAGRLDRLPAARPVVDPRRRPDRDHLARAPPKRHRDRVPGRRCAASRLVRTGRPAQTCGSTRRDGRVGRPVGRTATVWARAARAVDRRDVVRGPATGRPADEAEETVATRRRARLSRLSREIFGPVRTAAGWPAGAVRRRVCSLPARVRGRGRADRPRRGPRGGARWSRAARSTRAAR